MPDSDDDIRRLCEMFDSFCKKVLRNYARDLERAARRIEKHEIITDSPLHFLRSSAQAAIGTRVDEINTIMCLDRPCTIVDETLYGILLSLPEKQRNVILCDVWLNMADAEIAAAFDVTVKTVYNWRQRACRQIKQKYERSSPK